MVEQPEQNTPEISSTMIRALIQEAKRCLQCPRPTCRTGCPIGNDIPSFITEVAKGNFGQALAIVSNKSNLPAVCGRVCPKELQCEGHCVLAKKGNPVSIGLIEHSIADIGFALDIYLEPVPQKTRGKIAVIGSGPAGLTVAGDLARQGFHSTIFEAESIPGGVLQYGIPDFRLGKDVVHREISRIESLGVQILTNKMVGKDFTVDTIFEEGYDAIFIGTGTALAKELDIPGRDLFGVASASYLLHNIRLFEGEKIPESDVPLRRGDTVAVIGGGNVAIDAARTAIRNGAKEVSIIFFMEQEELTALPSEYQLAVDDGIKFYFNANSKEFIADSTGRMLTGVKVDTPEGEKIIPADRAFVAIGARPADRIVSTTTGIDVDERGYVITHERPYGMTTRKAVFAGGDVVHQPATVVLAMREAKKVAQSIAEYVDAIHLLNL